MSGAPEKSADALTGPVPSADGDRGSAQPAAAPFMLLGDAAAPGCVGDECALPTPPAPPS